MYILSLTPPPGKSYKGTSSSASRILTVRVADASPSPSLSLSHSLSLFLTLSLPLPCVRSLWQYPSFSPFFSHPRCRLERGRSAGGICTGTQVQGRGRSVEQASDVACTGGRGTSIKRKKGKGKEKKKKKKRKTREEEEQTHRLASDLAVCSSASRPAGGRTDGWPPRGEGFTRTHACARARTKQRIARTYGRDVRKSAADTKDNRVGPSRISL